MRWLLRKFGLVLASDYEELEQAAIELSVAFEGYHAAVNNFANAAGFTTKRAADISAKIINLSEFRK